MRRAGHAFGTTVFIRVEGLAKPEAEAALDAAFAEIRLVERVASLTNADSEISRLNRDGALKNPHPAFVEMLRFSQRLHQASNGAFDITVQPLWLLCDGKAKQGAWPNAAELEAARRLADQGKLQVDEDYLSFAEPGMGMTLNGVAQGYAADRVAAVLRARGVTSAFFDTGEIEALGLRPDRSAWTAAIQHPRHADKSVALANVTGALATSGDYEYFWSPDFERNHILDPRTGVSPKGFASASVLAPTGLAATRSPRRFSSWIGRRARFC